MCVLSACLGSSTNARDDVFVWVCLKEYECLWRVSIRVTVSVPVRMIICTSCGGDITVKCHGGVSCLVCAWVKCAEVMCSVHATLYISHDDDPTWSAPIMIQSFRMIWSPHDAVNKGWCDRTEDDAFFASRGVLFEEMQARWCSLVFDLMMVCWFRWCQEDEI